MQPELSQPYASPQYLHPLVYTCAYIKTQSQSLPKQDGEKNATKPTV